MTQARADELAALLDTFEHHSPTEEQVSRITGVRRACKDAAYVFMQLCPPSADRTAALRKLHEAMMTANKSIVLEPAK